MFQLLKRLVRPKGQTPITVSDRGQFEHPARRTIPDEITRFIREDEWNKINYPPFKDGFPAPISGAALMFAFHQRIIDRIHGSLGIPDDEYFRYVQPVLVNFAELVHLLPASEAHHHCGQGGLMHHSLEVAALTLDACLMRSFDANETPSRRSHRLRRWYVAGLLAGLAHDVGKAVTDVTVRNHSDTVTWNTLVPICQWAQENNLTRYFITWSQDRHNRHKEANLTLIYRIIPDEAMAWLLEGGTDIFSALADAIIGKDSFAPLSECVKWADSTSVKRDLSKGPRGGAGSDTGVPVVRLLCDAMQRLVDEGRWTTNEPGSRVWVTTQGIFIPWKAAAADLIKDLETNGIGGFPRSTDALLTMLVNQDVAVSSDDGEVFWSIAPAPLRKNGKTPILRCMKLKSADVLFPHVPVPPPISCMIGREGDQKEFLTSDDKYKGSLIEALNSSASIAENEKPCTQQEAEKPDLATNIPTVDFPPPNPDVAQEPSFAPIPPTDTPDAHSSENGNQESGIEPPTAETQQTEPSHEERDSNLETMLGDINGSPIGPAQDDRDDVEIVNKPKAKLSDIFSSKDEPIAEAPPAEAKAKVRIGEILKREQASKAQQSNPSQLAMEMPPPAQIFSEELKAQLTEVIASSRQDDAELLNSNQDLALALLQTGNDTTRFKYVQSRIWCAFDNSGFRLEDLEALKLAGWVWQNFLDEDTDGFTKVVSRRKGFILNRQLSEFVNHHFKLGFDLLTLDAFPEEEHESYRKAVEMVCELGMKNASKWPSVMTITRGNWEQVSDATNLPREKLVQAIALFRDSISIARARNIYVRLTPLEQGQTDE